MKVLVCYMAHLKEAAGTATETVVLEPPCSAIDLARRLAAQHGAALHRLLLDGQGRLQPTILLFVNDVQITGRDDTLLGEGDEVSFLAPIAGGQ